MNSIHFNFWGAYLENNKYSIDEILLMDEKLYLAYENIQCLINFNVGKLSPFEEKLLHIIQTHLSPMYELYYDILCPECDEFSSETWDFDYFEKEFHFCEHCDHEFKITESQLRLNFIVYDDMATNMCDYSKKRQDLTKIRSQLQYNFWEDENLRNAYPKLKKIQTEDIIEILQIIESSKHENDQLHEQIELIKTYGVLLFVENSEDISSLLDVFIARSQMIEDNVTNLSREFENEHIENIRKDQRIQTFQKDFAVGQELRIRESQENKLIAREYEIEKEEKREFRIFIEEYLPSFKELPESKQNDILGLTKDYETKIGVARLMEILEGMLRDLIINPFIEKYAECYPNEPLPTSPQTQKNIEKNLITLNDIKNILKNFLSKKPKHSNSQNCFFSSFSLAKNDIEMILDQFEKKIDIRNTVNHDNPAIYAPIECQIHFQDLLKNIQLIVRKIGLSEEYMSARGSSDKYTM